MQRLEVSGAVRPIYGSLGVKRLKLEFCPQSFLYDQQNREKLFRKTPLSRYFS